MKLAFIAMSGLRVEDVELAELGLTLPGFIDRREVIASLPSLGLLTLAGMTPKNIHCCYIELQSFDPSQDLPDEFDAVAISSFTAQIEDAYCLADRYRACGTQVILGGLHVTALPDEAQAHADAVVLGEGELAWPTLCNDLLNGNLKSRYDTRGLSFDLSKSSTPQFNLLDPTQYNRLTVQSQRGCPFCCEFCASSIRLSPTFKVKPVERVIAEIRAIKEIWNKPFIELADDNSFANKQHARRLVRAIAEERIKWFTETDVSIADDLELLDLLSDSGCRQLLIGFESPSSGSLGGVELKTDWKLKQLDRYQEAIHRIQSRGISVNGCFMLGLDGQDDYIFQQTMDFVADSGLSEVQVTLQTPFPGTELYQRLKSEERLLEQRFWKKCTLFDVNFQPSDMTVSALQAGFRNLMEELYAEPVAKHRKQSFLQQARGAHR
jgi:radical SAM superfamily enzyme YgiQ (UPF0313 family)